MQMKGTEYTEQAEAESVASEQARNWHIEFVVWEREGFYFPCPIGTTISPARIVAQFGVDGTKVS